MRPKIIDKLKAFREKNKIHGEFGNCYNCGLLYDVKKKSKNLPKLFRFNKKTTSIKNN